MCRLLGYLGSDLSILDLLYDTDNSLIKQSYQPQLMKTSFMLNLAGFGMMAWDYASYEPQFPYIYRTTELPFYDRNLAHMARKLYPNCFLAHIRGTLHRHSETINYQNIHPFTIDNSPLAFAHNGSLFGIEKIKKEMMKLIKPCYLNEIKGTTDSELIYALFLSQFEHKADHDDIDKVEKVLVTTLKIIRDLRVRYSLHLNSPVNLLITNGKFMLATRLTYDYGRYDNLSELDYVSYHSLWYTFGEIYTKSDSTPKMQTGESQKRIIIASEPLTMDTTTWIEVPQYSLLKVSQSETNQYNILTKNLDV